MELKPCPFCGSDDVGLYVCGGEPEERESFFVICNSCHGSTGEYRTRKLVQSIWNTRASDTQRTSQIHAHWIINGKWAECSNCHESSKIAVLEHKDFCGACGATMDEGSVVIHP